jgi:hypothetical protein
VAFFLGIKNPADRETTIQSGVKSGAGALCVEALPYTGTKLSPKNKTEKNIFTQKPRF